MERPWENLARPWNDAMTALADAYERACRTEGVEPDAWAVGALRAAADQRTWLIHAASPPEPAATWDEHDARRRAVEATWEAARTRRVDVPDHVTERLLAWIHDVKGWNA